MNKLTFYLIVLACIVILLGIIYVLIRDRKKLKKEKKQLEDSLLIARNNVEQLTDYIHNSEKIQKEEKVIAEKIKEAGTDEEVHNIINDIIALNNSRVQNN